jgi:hypothetical protein
VAAIGGPLYMMLLYPFIWVEGPKATIFTSNLKGTAILIVAHPVVSIFNTFVYFSFMIFVVKWFSASHGLSAIRVLAGMFGAGIIATLILAHVVNPAIELAHPLLEAIF